MKDGNKFIRRLKEGASDNRSYAQLVNIATDGESYGHHTKFGDMALSYVLKVRAKEEGFNNLRITLPCEKRVPKSISDIKMLLYFIKSF